MMRLTDSDIETIRIHLNAYKEELFNQGRLREALEYERIIERLTDSTEGRTNERD